MLITQNSSILALPSALYVEYSHMVCYYAKGAALLFLRRTVSGATWITRYPFPLRG
jgi:hypothetical protein